MEKEKGKEPEALPDEALDDAAGGLPAVQGASLSGITDGTSNTVKGGLNVAVGDVNGDGVNVLMGDGSVRTVKPGT